MPASLAAAFGCAMAGAALASAGPQASDLAGRWVISHAVGKEACRDPGCRQVYDLVPCGAGWCGIEVRDDNACGRTALRLDAGAPAQHAVSFSGSFERAAATQAYIVRARLYTRPPQSATPKQLVLLIEGSTDGVFQAFRRIYPLHMFLVRTGDALCRGEAKTS